MMSKIIESIDIINIYLKLIIKILKNIEYHCFLINKKTIKFYVIIYNTVHN